MWWREVVVHVVEADGMREESRTGGTYAVEYALERALSILREQRKKIRFSFQIV
jgi:hypothetical protein